MTAGTDRTPEPPLNIDQPILATVFREFETRLNKSGINQVGVVGGEFAPSCRQPLRHQHPPRHSTAARRVLQLVIARSNPDFRIVLDGVATALTHVLLDEPTDVVVDRRDAVGTVGRRENRHQAQFIVEGEHSWGALGGVVVHANHHLPDNTSFTNIVRNLTDLVLAKVLVCPRVVLVSDANCGEGIVECLLDGPW